MLTSPTLLGIAPKYAGFVAYAASDDNVHLIRKGKPHPAVHLHRHPFHHAHPKHRVKFLNGHLSAAQVL